MLGIIIGATLTVTGSVLAYPGGAESSSEHGACDAPNRSCRRSFEMEGDFLIGRSTALMAPECKNGGVIQIRPDQRNPEVAMAAVIVCDGVEFTSLEFGDMVVRGWDIPFPAH